MALVTRYFAPTASGSGDGTSVANAAALVSGGAWSSVILNFDFSANGMFAALLPGTNPIFTVSTPSTSYTVAAPSTTHPLFIHGCDASGNPLSPPDPNWTSDQPAWDDSSLPVIGKASNIFLFNVPNVFFRLIKYVGSNANTNPVLSGLHADWCTFTESGMTTTAASIMSSMRSLTNCVVTGDSASTAYSGLVGCFTSAVITNNRLSAPTGTSGTRYGISATTTNVAPTINGNTIVNVGGDAVHIGGGVTTAAESIIRKNTIVNVGGGGIVLAQTAALQAIWVIEHNCVTGCGGAAISGSFDVGVVLSNRIRDCGSAVVGLSAEFNTYSVAGTDATDYNDPASGDYRIKDATVASKGMGVSVVTSGGSGNGDDESGRGSGR